MKCEHLRRKEMKRVSVPKSIATFTRILNRPTHKLQRAMTKCKELQRNDDRAHLVNWQAKAGDRKASKQANKEKHTTLAGNSCNQISGKQNSRRTGSGVLTSHSLVTMMIFCLSAKRRQRITSITMLIKRQTVHGCATHFDWGNRTKHIPRINKR